MIKIAIFVLILQNEFFDLAEETINLQTDCYFLTIRQNQQLNLMISI